MIPLKTVKEIHSRLIDRFGGAQGIRDISALESAISRPFQTFDGAELYPTTIEKGASLIESILINHPFIDGNKRTGYVLLRLLLISNGLDFSVTQDQCYSFIIDIASGKLNTEGIVHWLIGNTSRHSTTKS